MPMIQDDDFTLRFPVVEDRQLRRIELLKIILVIFIPTSFLMAGTVSHWSRQRDSMWPNKYGEFDHSSPYFIIGMLFLMVFFLSIISLIVVSIIESKIFVRRYGWRAMSDPIEAQRIAMREALYDVATGSTQAMA